MGWPIDMKRNGCESIGCYTHFVTLNVHFTHDLDLGFSRSNFENAVSQEWEGRLSWNEKDLSRQNVGPMLWLSMFTSSMTLTLDFQGQILKKSNLRNGLADWHGTKWMWVDRMRKTHIVTSNFDLTHELDLGFSRLNIEIAVIYEWEGRLTLNERDVSWIWCWMHNGIDLGPRCMAYRSAK